MGREADRVIRVKDDNWERLNSLKEPGDTFDDVVTKLLEEEQENPSPMTAMTAD